MNCNEKGGGIVDEFAGLRAAERCPNKTNVASRSAIKLAQVGIKTQRFLGQVNRNQGYLQYKFNRFWWSRPDIVLALK